MKSENCKGPSRSLDSVVRRCHGPDQPGGAGPGVAVAVWAIRRELNGIPGTKHKGLSLPILSGGG